MQDTQDAFDVFNTDGSGSNDYKELNVVLRALSFEPKEEKIAKMITDVCDGGIGTIEHQELLKIMTHKDSHPQSQGRTFEAFPLVPSFSEGGGARPLPPATTGRVCLKNRAVLGPEKVRVLRIRCDSTHLTSQLCRSTC